MTTKTTRAVLATLMLAASSFALTNFAAAQDRTSTEASGTRAGRPASATPAKPTGPSVTAPVSRALSKVPALVGEKKFPEAMVAVREAEKAATTDYDRLKVNQFLTLVAINMGDEATATAAAEAAADLPAASIPDEDKIEVYRNAASLANNAKHPDKALTYARQLIALNANDASSRRVLNVVMYGTAPPAEATAYFQKQIDAALAMNQKPARDVVDMKINAHLKANDNAGAETTLEQALLLFNDPKDWDQMFNVAITTPGIRDIDAVMAGRLMFATGFPVTRDNAQLIGETSQKMGFYGDSQIALTKGANLPLLDIPRANADKASMPEQIRMGANQNGVYNVKLAEALYGYGMYPQAEAAARLALTKGGIDASEAQMLIGMSLYQQGKLPEASQAFTEVRGGSPATPRIARLWNTFIQTKTGATASAAPAPAPAR